MLTLIALEGGGIELVQEVTEQNHERNAVSGQRQVVQQRGRVPV